MFQGVISVDDKRSSDNPSSKGTVVLITVNQNGQTEAEPKTVVFS